MTNEKREDLIRPGERLDDLQIGGLELIQNRRDSALGLMRCSFRILQR